MVLRGRAVDAVFGPSFPDLQKAKYGSKTTPVDSIYGTGFPFSSRSQKLKFNMKGSVCINSVSSVTISVDVSSCLFHISLQIDKL